MNVENLKEAHKTILEVYSRLINIKATDEKEEMFEAIRAAVDTIEEQTTKALGRIRGNE